MEQSNSVINDKENGHIYQGQGISGTKGKDQSGECITILIENHLKSYFHSYVVSADRARKCISQPGES